MPFESKSQQRFMFAKHPEIAKEFAAATPDISKLPEHVKKMDEGGIAEPDDKKFAADLGQGIKEGVNHDSDAVKSYLSSKFAQLLHPGMGEDVPQTTMPQPNPTTAPQSGMAEGGKVERSSLEHPVPNGMMARAMSDGGYPHVTFLENESPSEVKKDTHMEGHKAGPMDVTETGEKNNPPHMAEGGYPHVTYTGNISPAKVNAITHAEHVPHTPATSTETGRNDDPTHMAEGGKTPHFLEGLKKGALHKELGISEDKTIPAKKLEHAANSDDETLRKRAQFAINAKKWHHAEGDVIPHEEKMNEIYKAMGIKKYADGGSVPPPTPAGPPAPPSQNDPGFWDQIKSVLGQVGGTLSNALPTMPGVAQGTADIAATPGIAPAINAGLGTNLQGPAAVPPPVAPPPPPAAPGLPPVAPPTGIPGGTASSTPQPAMPNLGTLFNQDTSKLTAGVNPEDRQALVQKLQDQQHGLGAVIAQAVSGLGDAIAAKGGVQQHSLQNIFSMQKQQRDEALANFDKARQDRLQTVSVQTQLGDNALKQAAAIDAYGVDDHLNGMIGAPKGTMKKDLPTYFQIMSAQVAKQEKDADLYMKSHAQASTDVDNAVKNASVLGIKPSAAQLEASGAKLADQYFNRARGNILVKPSDGGQAQWIPAQNLSRAKQMDPNLSVQP